MSQIKRKSELPKFGQNSQTKTQHEKTSSLPNHNLKQKAISKIQNEANEKIRQYLEDHSLTDAASNNTSTLHAKDSSPLSPNSNGHGVKHTILGNSLGYEGIKLPHKETATIDSNRVDETEEESLSSDRQAKSQRTRKSAPYLSQSTNRNNENQPPKDQQEESGSTNSLSYEKKTSTNSEPIRVLTNQDDDLEIEQSRTELPRQHQNMSFAADEVLQARINGSEQNAIESLHTEGKEALSTHAPEDAQLESAIYLRNSANRLTVKTFLALRSIIKPNKCILKALHSLLCLFAGVDVFVPRNMLHMDDPSWNMIKSYLQSPIFLINQIQIFMEVCQDGKVPPENLAKASEVICSIDPDQTYVSESYNSILNYVLSAIEYYKEKFDIENLNKHLPQPEVVYSPTRISKTFANQRSSTAQKSLSPRNFTPHSLSEGKKTNNMNHSNSTSSRVKMSLMGNNGGGSKQVLRYLEAKALEDAEVLGRFETISSRPIKEFEPKSTPTKRVNNQFDNRKTSTTPKRRVQDPPLTARNTSTTPRKTQHDSNEKINLTAKVLRLPKNDLASKLDRLIEEKNNRVSYQSTARTVQSPEDRQYVAELTQRSHNEEETQYYKKTAQEFKQKTAKLLLAHDRKRKADAKAQEDAKLQYERDNEISEKRNLEEYLELKRKGEVDYDLEVYEERQQARRLLGAQKKEIEEDFLYHELEQNLVQHYHQAEIELDQKIDRQQVLQKRLEQMQVDRAFKKQQQKVEHTEQVKEIVERKSKDHHWKKIDALNDRINAEKEYLLIEKLLSG